MAPNSWWTRAPLWDPDPETFDASEAIQDKELQKCQISDFALMAFEVLRHQGVIRKSTLAKFTAVYLNTGLIRPNRPNSGRPGLAPDGTILTAAHVFLKGDLEDGAEEGQFRWHRYNVHECEGYEEWYAKLTQTFENGPDEGEINGPRPDTSNTKSKPPAKKQTRKPMQPRSAAGGQKGKLSGSRPIPTTNTEGSTPDRKGKGRAVEDPVDNNVHIFERWLKEDPADDPENPITSWMENSEEVQLQHLTTMAVQISGQFGAAMKYIEQKFHNQEMRCTLKDLLIMEVFQMETDKDILRAYVKNPPARPPPERSSGRLEIDSRLEENNDLEAMLYNQHRNRDILAPLRQKNKHAQSGSRELDSQEPHQDPPNPGADAQTGEDMAQELDQVVQNSNGATIRTALENSITNKRQRSSDEQAEGPTEKRPKNGAPTPAASKEHAISKESSSSQQADGGEEGASVGWRASRRRRGPIYSRWTN